MAEEILRVEGLADLQRKLNAIPEDLRIKVMLALLRKAAQPIIKAAVRLAPEAEKGSNRVIPGLIKRTMRVAKSKFHNPSAGDFGVYIKPMVPGAVKRLKRLAGRVRRAGGSLGNPNFGDPFYYKFQEFGFHATGGRKISGGTRRRAAALKSGGYTKVPGKHFLGDAFEQQKGAALNIITSDLIDQITKRFNK